MAKRRKTKKERVFSDKEFYILELLYRSRTEMTSNEIAGRLGYSWATVENYMSVLNKDKYVKVKNKKWSFNFSKQKKLKEKLGL